MIEVFYALFLLLAFAAFIWFSVQVHLFLKGRIDEISRERDHAKNELHEVLTSKSLQDYRVWLRVQELKELEEKPESRRRDNATEAEIAGVMME